MRQNKLKVEKKFAHFSRILPSTPMQLALSWTVLTSYRSAWSYLLALSVSWSKTFQLSTRTGWSGLWAELASTSAQSQLIIICSLAVRLSPCSASAGWITATSTAQHFSSASMEATVTSCFLIVRSLSTICACTLKIAHSRALFLDATRSLVSAATCASTSRKFTRNLNLILARDVKRDLLKNIIVICTRKIASKSENITRNFYLGFFAKIISITSAFLKLQRASAIVPAHCNEKSKIRLNWWAT